MTTQKSISTSKSNPRIKKINHHAAVADIGSRSHFIAISPKLDQDNVREFKTFTEDLEQAIKWLKAHKITSVAMESTGTYWINFYDMLQQSGIEAVLVNARHVKNVPGRKSDVLDSQWLQELHSYGLLHASFRPKDEICKLRGYMRHRETLTSNMSTQILLMQKCLNQMNLQLHHVLSDITGATGSKIIRDIVAGERDPKKLASYRDVNCKNSEEMIQKALTGNYREEHLFALKQSLEAYDFYLAQLNACDVEIQKIVNDLKQLNTDNDPIPKSKKRQIKPKKTDVNFDVRTELFNMLGVDLTAIDGINGHTALKIIAEIGKDVSAWPTVKHFASWLGLAPGTKISGGKVLNNATKTCVNRVATAFRIAAHALHHTDTALGAFFRRKRSQLGAPKAITATAHKLARIFYFMMKNRTEYKSLDQKHYEQKYQERAKKAIIIKAAKLGLKMVDEASPIAI